ncbi:MAG TPA: hypothetical protein VGL02_19770 [Streptomyces sp.]
MDATPHIRALGPREPRLELLDANRVLVDLALAEHDARAEGRDGAAAGLVEAQAIVRRHAGIPTHTTA